LWSIVLGKASRPLFLQPPAINRRQEGRLSTTFAVLRLYTNSRNSPCCASLVKERSMYELKFMFYILSQLTLILFAFLSTRLITFP